MKQVSKPLLMLRSSVSLCLRTYFDEGTVNKAVRHFLSRL